MKTTGEYIISGGLEGKKRLATLADVLYSSTRSFLQANGVGPGTTLLDVGCGGGNVSLMAAGMVGDTGKVTGVDFDEEIIRLNQLEAAEKGITNVTYQAMDVSSISFSNQFDVVYARFLLSHLKDPLAALKNMLHSAKPGGRIIVEDIQFSGHFCYPPCTAFERYVQLFTLAGQQRGQNPEIGPELFTLFKEAGIREVNFDVIQPAFASGPGKWMAYITLEKIQQAILQQGLADQSTITALLKELEAYTKKENTTISLPRIFRVRGVK